MVPVREIPRTGVDVINGKGYSSKKYEIATLNRLGWDPVTTKHYSINYTDEQLRELHTKDREEVHSRNFDDEFKADEIVRSTTGARDQVSRFLEKYRRKDNFH